MAKPSERAEEIIKEIGGTIRSRQIRAVLQVLDEEWEERHQSHTKGGVSCRECREYGFVVRG